MNPVPGLDLPVPLIQGVGFPTIARVASAVDYEGFTAQGVSHVLDRLLLREATQESSTPANYDCNGRNIDPLIFPTSGNGPDPVSGLGRSSCRRYCKSPRTV